MLGDMQEMLSVFAACYVNSSVLLCLRDNKEILRCLFSCWPMNIAFNTCCMKWLERSV